MKYFYLKLVIISVILVLLTIFVIDNINESVNLSFYGLLKIKEIPVVIIIFLSIIFGVFISIPAVRKNIKTAEKINKD